MKANNHRYFVSKGFRFSVHADEQGVHHVWRWANVQSGWKWCGDFNTHEDAYRNMIASSPSGVTETERDYTTIKEA